MEDRIALYLASFLPFSCPFLALFLPFSCPFLSLFLFSFFLLSLSNFFVFCKEKHRKVRIEEFINCCCCLVMIYR
ncbi:hypothetical protein BZA77DRAFT_133570 [Pyronema omphalodes]|nr:hypothetical protein BZA77DRAFT_133570 [Pyronema omphalodes]